LPDNQDEEKFSRLEPLWFVLSCLAIALLLFGLRFVDITFEDAIKQTYVSGSDQLWATLTAVVYGSLMIAGLLFFFPVALLEKSKLVRRTKKVLGL
jgi:hypothetical protein